MNPKPLSVEARSRVNEALIQARTQGLDTAEHLNSQGLLLTAPEDKRIRLEAMQFLLNRITEWTPAEFMRRGREQNWTAAGMYREMVRFIEEYMEWWEREQ